MFLEYIILFKYLCFAFILGILLTLLSYLFVFQNPDIEKSSSYECGFNPWGDARNKFEIRFYLVAILFIIFDLEIAFLFPWIIMFKYFYLKSFSIIIAFILILTVGFIYEWAKGALEWE